MMQIEFNDGQTVDCEGVHSSNHFYQGTSREMYTFLFQPDTDLNMLSELFTPENCEKITIHTEDGGKFVHEHFTIRYGIGCSLRENAISDNYNSTSAANSEEGEDAFLAWVKMVQTTLSERKIQEHQDVLDTLLISTLMA